MDKNMKHLVESVDFIVKHMATKSDLEDMATKGDLTELKLELKKTFTEWNPNWTDLKKGKWINERK